MRKFLLILLFISQCATADEIQLNTFQNGEVADADEVNENFNNLKSAIQASAPSIFYYEETFNPQSVCVDGYYGGVFLVFSIIPRHNVQMAYLIKLLPALVVKLLLAEDVV